eukprot:gene5640-7786_t
MSYNSFNNEEAGLMEKVDRSDESFSNESSNNSFNIWKTILLVGSVAIISLLVVSSTFSKDSDSPVSKASLLSTSMKSVKTVKTGYSQLSEDEKRTLFEDFKEKFDKKYASTHEETERYAYFKEFLALIDSRNYMELQKKGTALHGITQFADLSHTEFQKNFLGYKSAEKSGGSKAVQSKIVLVVDQPSQSVDSVDWSGIYTTAVKDQGYCGSCWAFSATEQIESDAIRAKLLTTSDELSPQQIVSCDKIDYGCSGGWTEMAYEYVMSSGGLVSATEYPYTSYWAATGSCISSDTTNKLVTVEKYYSLVLTDAVSTENNMAAYMLTTGPISVCLDAEDWSSYTSGIYSACGSDVDHCVQAVGVSLSGGYWKIRNSWGTSWGDDGYIYLAYGADTCKLTNDPSTLSVVKA